MVAFTEVRALCKTYAREDIGDSVIGELLSKAPPGADGVWPCEPVREALEEVGTKIMAEGMAVGLYNQRGVHSRGEGGAQERELAAKYRDWSRRVAIDAPFTSRLLERIAQRYDRDARGYRCQPAEAAAVLTVTKRSTSRAHYRANAKALRLIGRKAEWGAASCIVAPLRECERTSRLVLPARARLPGRVEGAGRNPAAAVRTTSALAPIGHLSPEFGREP